MNGHPLVYLDNGATTQKPRAVIDAISRFYTDENANIHRGVYALSQIATDRYEHARAAVRRFINAAEDAEIIFTRGTTESINLLAQTFGRANLGAGDEIVISAMEHHSNIVPWQMLCQQTGAILRVIPINDAGELLLDAYRQLLASGRVKLVAVNHVSNSLGTINDAATIIRLAHNVGAKTLIDGAQWVGHYRTDVRALGCDFYAFSGHKLFGPTGIGVLYGRRELLEAMPPWQGGGDMIATVAFDATTYAELPAKFEAGTPNIAGAVGLAAAIEYVSAVGLDRAARHEEQLLEYATPALRHIPGLRLIGTAAHKSGILSFVLENPPVASLDAGMGLSADGIAVRTGHHCCMPVMRRMGVSGTIRASLAMYNTAAEVDALIDSLKRIVRSAARPRPVPPAAAAPADNAATAAGNPNRSSVQPIPYPAPSADTVRQAADEIADTLEFLGDRDERNQFLLELGEKLPAMPGVLKVEHNLVHGCMSIVHMYGRHRPGTDDAIEFIADSDAHIVRGLIAVLQQLFSGQSAREVLAFDVEAFFRRIGLETFISSQRRNGLAGMVKRIRALAGEVARGDATP